MKLLDSEKREILNLVEADKPLPDKYRFLLFDDKRDPTPNPEALLERIIKASSNESDLIADFFCVSKGTRVLKAAPPPHPSPSTGRDGEGGVSGMGRGLDRRFYI